MSGKPPVKKKRSRNRLFSSQELALAMDEARKHYQAAPPVISKVWQANGGATLTLTVTNNYISGKRTSRLDCILKT